MKPIREIVIREYLPGSYEVEEGGRTMSYPSREQLRCYLRRELDLPGDPDDLDKINELEQVIDTLREDAQDLARQANEGGHD